MNSADRSGIFLPHDHPMPSPRKDTHDFIKPRHDPVRDYSVALALETVMHEGLEGDMAELGVFQGHMAALYHQVCPNKRLYLFDTFEGFPKEDLEVTEDSRFKETSVDSVKALFNGLFGSLSQNVIFRKGYFPETAAGLEDNRFCFAMLDPDLYAPTLAGLEFFYPRMVPGGYIFAHDYTSYESNQAVSRAVNGFLADKPERVIHLPDEWGSVVFRKV